MLVLLYKRESDKPAYYYSLDDRQQNLFNPFTVTVSWGLQPDGGVKKLYTFESLSEKNLFIRKTLKKKMRTYKVLYSYFKEQTEGLRNATGLNSDTGAQASDFFGKV